MNCSHAENLLPLYVEGDLADSRLARDLARHLRSCAACARLADEYRESQDQLRLYAPPQFAEGFFQEIRQAVMTEIERSGAQPTVIPFPTPLDSRRTTLAVAASLALLLASAALALHFLRQRAPMETVPPSVANVNPMSPPPASAPPESLAGRREATVEAPRRAQTASNSISSSPGSSTRARRPASAGARRERSSQASVMPAAIPVRLTEERGTPDEAAQGRATEPPVMRMEIQTSDPTIRIIWFAPRSTE